MEEEDLYKHYGLDIESSADTDESGEARTKEAVVYAPEYAFLEGDEEARDIHHFFNKARANPPVKPGDRVFSHRKLKKLAEIINTTGLTYATTQTLKQMLKNYQFVDLTYLCPKLHPKKIASSSVKILKQLERLNVQLYKVTKALKKEIATAKHNDSYMDRLHAENRLSLFDRIRADYTLLLSEIRVAYAFPKPSRAPKNTCTII